MNHIGSSWNKPRDRRPEIALDLSCKSLRAARGEDIVYSVRYTNIGNFEAQIFAVINRIPLYTDYRVDSATAGSLPRGVTEVTIAYSDDNGATYSYRPASGGGGAAVGYDRKVTAIRWTFGGSLGYALGLNTGLVGFTVAVR